MKIYTFPDGHTLSWSGDLAEKIILLERSGIIYTPTAAELAEQSRKAGAKTEATLATQFKTLTPQQAVTYIREQRHQPGNSKRCIEDHGTHTDSDA